MSGFWEEMAVHVPHILPTKAKQAELFPIRAWNVAEFKLSFTHYDRHVHTYRGFFPKRSRLNIEHTFEKLILWPRINPKSIKQSHQKTLSLEPSLHGT